ncbi:MAG: RNA polymerase sporulation sigma factor SigF [Paenibacillaceae bacterium]|jgi:RNA polymerase sporulation-specific sigma factor|nr:RNA polymerase sporulation sigma factor SigF [Paenibacillaceae bacterium]
MRAKAQRAQPSESLDDASIKRLLRMSQQGNKSARDHIVHANVRLVWSVVQRFAHRGYEPDDLFQIGCIGLMKAIDKFDFSYDVKFSTYAVPMIIGEMQRFLRDDGTVKVSRSLKELSNKLRRAKEQWMGVHGTSPTVQQLAHAVGVDVADVIVALDATRATASIDETVFENDGDPILLIDQLADDDGDWFEKFALQEAMNTLNEREKLLVTLRYFHDLTQAQVAKRLGISQVQVSRLEKKILHHMRQQCAMHPDVQDGKESG